MGDVKQFNQETPKAGLNMQQRFKVKIYFNNVLDSYESDCVCCTARNVNLQDGMMIIINEDMSISGYNNSTIESFEIKNITNEGDSDK